MKSRAGPSGGGGIGMKCRNMFEPNTPKINPSRLRAIIVAILIRIILLCFSVSGENSKSRGFQNNLAARMTAFAQFVSAPGFRQGKYRLNHCLYLAGVDQPGDLSQVG